MPKKKTPKKNLRWYRQEVKRLNADLQNLRELRQADHSSHCSEIQKLELKLNEANEKYKTLSPNSLVSQLQQALTANAHALEAIAKMAQPGVF